MSTDIKALLAADSLREAAETGQTIPPIRSDFDEGDIDGAYEVQNLNTAAAVKSGRRISGRKIGLTAKAVQAQMGVDQPDFGVLFTDMAYADGVEIENSRVLQPRVEGEIAFVIGSDLDRGPHSVVDIIRATEFIVPSIEVVDSRITDWDITIVDTVADNASAGLYVLGTRPRSLADFDLRSIPMTMTINGSEVSTGIGAACLGNPLHSALWLADTLCERGTPLLAGDVIMSGALGPMAPLSVGDDVVVDFGDLGSVSTRLIDA